MKVKSSAYLGLMQKPFIFVFVGSLKHFAKYSIKSTALRQSPCIIPVFVLVYLVLEFLNCLVNTELSISLAGNMAIRSPEKGSWFISTVCDMLQSDAHRNDLQSILTDVTDEIAQKTEYIHGRYKCTPDVHQNLRRKLFFKPEFTWSEYMQRNLLN